VLKSLSDTYLNPCTLGDPYACQYADPLAASPYMRAQLQCVPSATVAGTGQCALGPQKANDGCNVGAECASGTCQKRGSSSCTGIEEGNPCTPPSGDNPDPCEAAHWCAPTGVGGRGTCQKVVSKGKLCGALGACEQGTICANSGAGEDNRCIPYLSVPENQNTTVGPYLCASGTALLVSQNPRVFTCMLPNVTKAMVGNLCGAGTPLLKLPPGYECECAADGKQRVTTVGGAFFLRWSMPCPRALAPHPPPPTHKPTPAHTPPPPPPARLWHWVPRLRVPGPVQVPEGRGDAAEQALPLRLPGL
jgi:hypothetical protein